MGKAEQHFEDRTEAGLGSPHSEASKMLEAALQQMDGIISGKRESMHLGVQVEYAWCVKVSNNSFERHLTLLSLMSFWNKIYLFIYLLFI
jgi:hypothetical protein